MSKRIFGKVTTGLGVACRYLTMPYYKKQIKKKLGFYAYPGTLNLVINKNKESLLKDLIAIRIKSCEVGGKIIGGALCYKSKIKNINGIILVPDLTRHNQNILEFVADVNLRETLQLKDGRRLRIEVT